MQFEETEENAPFSIPGSEPVNAQPPIPFSDMTNGELSDYVFMPKNEDGTQSEDAADWRQNPEAVTEWNLRFEVGTFPEDVNPAHYGKHPRLQDLKAAASIYGGDLAGRVGY